MSNLAKIGWLTSPNVVFEHNTPLDLLKEGKIKQVVREAVGVGLT